eukprot:CAMPEP_0202686034 /NCGR_PEP_ID=MMETSP1385-20130828/1825_1 /ASSEMBLY_ACC=CAM_ASM_000861 /TAXON_ID=933848 /ORGANISM="Elphidium margaritaceum" /LENGTH=234 /DNA_ID=CAMNT_0049340527 /DNA_START=35 /DNA_END=739 /DNA_ORIENTATION=+
MAQSPCPHRIVDDMGYAFCMGSIGGAVWHCIKGYRNAPPGILNRCRGSTKAIAARAPVLGGNFAVWGLCFSSFDCVYLHLRRKDDPLNAIAAGASTGATLAWRAGVSSMAKSAMVGGVFLAVIEGLGLALQKMMTPNQQQGPISPYSTYKPGAAGGGPMNRHVGALDASDDSMDTMIGTNIAGADNSQPWNTNDGDLDDLDFEFDTFGSHRNNDDFDLGQQQNISFGNTDDDDV